MTVIALPRFLGGRRTETTQTYHFEDDSEPSVEDFHEKEYQKRQSNEDKSIFDRPNTLFVVVGREQKVDAER